MPRLSSAALAHWRRAPKAEGLTINLDRHIEQFWTLAARDSSIKLERFLGELASRVRKGEADARERMLAARLIERQCARPLPVGERKARRDYAIVGYISDFMIRNGNEKLKSAIAAAEQKFGCSRRTIFSALNGARRLTARLMRRRRSLRAVQTRN
jgi:hypothetical protein